MQFFLQPRYSAKKGAHGLHLEDMREIGRETERMAREGEITAYQKRATIELLLRGLREAHNEFREHTERSD